MWWPRPVLLLVALVRRAALLLLLRVLRGQAARRRRGQQRVVWGLPARRWWDALGSVVLVGAMQEGCSVRCGRSVAHRRLQLRYRSERRGVEAVRSDGGAIAASNGCNRKVGVVAHRDRAQGISRERAQRSPGRRAL